MSAQEQVLELYRGDTLLAVLSNIQPMRSLVIPINNERGHQSIPTQ